MDNQTDQTMTVSNPPAPPVVASTSVSVGISTYIGVLISVISALGAIYAGVKTNDTATITAAATGLLAALATIGSRTAQAVALTKAAAQVAAPIVNGAAAPAAAGGVSSRVADAATVVVNAGEEAVVDLDVDEVPVEDLPSDEEELAFSPDDSLDAVTDSAVHPDVPR